MTTWLLRALSLLFLVLPATSARAQGGSRMYLNQDIFVGQGQQIHHATCFFCSVQVEGDVTGNVLVLFGNLNVTGRVHGKATIIGGNAVIDSLARVGSTMIVGGNAVYESDESIAGNAWVLGGHISPAGGRHVRSSRRFSFSPVVSASAGVVAFLLLSVLFIPRRNSQPV